MYHISEQKKYRQYIHTQSKSYLTMLASGRSFRIFSKAMIVSWDQNGQYSNPMAIEHVNSTVSPVVMDYQ